MSAVFGERVKKAYLRSEPPAESDKYFEAPRPPHKSDERPSEQLVVDQANTKHEGI